LATILLLAAAAPATARDCRVPEAPPGVSVPPRPGCSAPEAKPARRTDPRAVRTGRNAGAILLENGTEIRIGGRVRFEAAGQR
jgi:hypothetical protein